jgi:importin-4
VIDINRNIDETLKLGGPAILVGQNVIAQICNQLISVITRQHACQVDEDEDEEAQQSLEESSEWDWLIVETALDALTSLAKALGPDFAELWKLFEKPVLKYVSSTDSNERAVATGTVAECILAMEGAVTPYTTTLMKVSLHRFGDEDTVTKANAIYATGLLCQLSTNESFILKKYNTILGKLEPLLADGTTGHLLDNAAGCVARLILAHPQNVPLQEVIPRLVELTPATDDYEVNGPIFRCFIWLCKLIFAQSAVDQVAYSLSDQNNNPTIKQFTPQIIAAGTQLLNDKDASENLDEEAKGQVQELVHYLSTH